MPRSVFLAFSLVLVLLPRSGIGSDSRAVTSEAEKLFAAKSYLKAHELYKKLYDTNQPHVDKRWVRFRLADTLWRSRAGSASSDQSAYQEAQRELSALVGEAKRPEDHDRIWAEAMESLGDLYWLRTDQRSSSGFSYYEQALDWWAGAPNIELARERYLSMVRRVALPPWREAEFYYGYHGMLPLPVAENFQKIAKSESDKILGHYMMAMTLRHSGGGYEQLRRVPEEFEAALKGGRGNDWYDDVLWEYGQFLESQGRLFQTKGGGWQYRPDYPGAVAAYRRLVGEFKKGESRFVEEAQERIEEIIRPEVGLSALGLFLPQSFVRFNLSWRNVKSIDFTLYRVDLAKHFVPPKKDESMGGAGGLIERIDLSRAEKVKSWSKATGDQGEHLPGSEVVSCPDKLGAGAYILEAKAPGLEVKRRDLLLVTDATLAVKALGSQTVAWFTNALDGAPIPNAKVTIWYRAQGNVWRSKDMTTNSDGIAPVALEDRHPNSSEYLAVAALEERQAFVVGSTGIPPSRGRSWRVYAFTDRPAYRPNEKVEWKFVVRAHDGSLYSTPAGEQISWEIQDPRSAKVFEGEAKLDGFGAAWGNFALGETHPLGEYRVTFRNGSGTVGSATLFRLEEYKLPEFAVQVRTPRENGQPKIYRLGDKVEAEIQVDYYFGGAVANADVEVSVSQAPFWPHWRPLREYGWYYDDLDPDPYRGYGYARSTIKHEVLKTDARGMARISFDTPRGTSNDFEYRIEARVTDSSRRQVVGADSVRVSRQKFFVQANPRHWLYRPRDKVTVDFKSFDANNVPVSAKGMVTITRDYWTELWVDHSGRRISDKELAAQRGKGRLPSDWRMRSSGYHHEQVLARSVATNTQGELELSFSPEHEGYYRAVWLTEEKGRNPITTETTVWVATETTTELGYRHGGLEIVVDRDTFTVGQEAPVMISVPSPDRWVLFSVEGSDLYNWRVVHVTGTAKLLRLPIEPKHVPNVFLEALLVSDKQLYREEKQVIVPPREHFLEVTVKPDREVYRPRDETTLSVHAADYAGKPVAAQFSIALVDESIFSIQQDYAGDPRQFYFGEKRRNVVSTYSLFNWRGYAPPPVEPALAKTPGDDSSDDLPDTEMAPIDSEYGGPGRDVNRSLAAPAKDKEGRMDRLAEKKAPKSAMALQEAAAPPEPQEGGGEVQVRSDFRATALFVPSVTTDARGNATVKAKLPESLTSWRATVRAVTQGSEFGIAFTSARTRQPLIVRLQAPRFFLVGDLVTVSAVVNNNTDRAFDLAPQLVAEGVRVEGALVDGKLRGATQPSRRVPPRGDARFDWQVNVKGAGPVKLEAVARAGSWSDAMELPFIAWPHGIEKMLAKGGKLRGDEARVIMQLPERKEGSTRMTVQVAPSQAVVMLDALPYLVGYPYGCTEQTMSRFLPAVIAAKTLRNLGLDPKEAMGRRFGGIEAASAPATRQPHQADKQNLDELQAMTDAGLRRLYDFQHSDGGWGWWKDGQSDRFMTAYVLWGLSLAREAGVAVTESVLGNAARYLDSNLVNEELNLDRQAWLLHALSVYQARAASGAMTSFQEAAFANLWKGREHLNPYARALLALAAVNYKKTAQATTLVENLENGVTWDKAEDASLLLRNEPSGQAMGTAHWGRATDWWHWSEGAVETTAFVLKALVAVDPKHRLVEPAMNWLVKNRRGAQWSNTRDTAITILALTDFLEASGEVAVDTEYTVSVNGKKVASSRIAKAEILSAPSTIEVDAKLLRDGANEIRIEKKKGAALYFSVAATFFSLEEPVKAAGHEIFVKRKYFKWVGRPTLLKGHVYERLPLSDGESIVSGERVETVVTVEAKNDYEYLVFEDLKPAGFEAVEVKSGQPLAAKEIRSDAQTRARDDISLEERLDYTGRTRMVHQELRDRKVALFVDKLEHGVWEIRYDLRAEAPGRFHALPTLGHAMYVPEIRCNGDEVRVQVLDR